MSDMYVRGTAKRKTVKVRRLLLASSRSTGRRIRSGRDPVVVASARLGRWCLALACAVADVFSRAVTSTPLDLLGCVRRLEAGRRPRVVEVAVPGRGSWLRCCPMFIAMRWRDAWRVTGGTGGSVATSVAGHIPIGSGVLVGMKICLAWPWPTAATFSGAVAAFPPPPP